MRTIQSEFQLHGVETTKKEATNCRKPTIEMSRREIEELMGVRRDTYIRRNGAIRQK